MATRPATKHMNIFRTVAYWEGISYILLLFVAMPLKYFADMPMAVRFVGAAHGALFVSYVVTLFLAHREAKWDISKSALYFGASLIPFATFYIDKSLKEEINTRREQYADE